MKINFFGDFVASSVNEVCLSEELQDIISKAEINVINCEAVCINPNNLSYHKLPKSGPNIYQDPNVPSWLENNGFNLISLSNNHILDYGEQALTDTMSTFKSATIFGCGSWKKAYSPVIVEKRDKKIGFLGLTHCEFGTLVDCWDNSLNYGAAWINHPNVNKIIVDTRKKVDYLFIFAHAGVEHLCQPLPEWRDRYRSFIDLGCDGVIASHPHITQGWETYKEKPIIYSLGNFYFPKNNSMPATWNKGLVITLSIDDNNKISLTVHPTTYKTEFIELDKSVTSQQNISELNTILNNEELYMNFINEAALSHLENFYTMFQNGGMARCHTLKKIIRIFMSFMQNKNTYNPAWFLNNIQCESHRWLFSRGFKLQHKFL